jgi:predicted Holliday junction resolvase-like endonuclease
MFELFEGILIALFGNTEARQLLKTLLVVQKELDEAEMHTTSVEAKLAELNERLKATAQQSLVEENQELKDTAEKLQEEIETSRGKMVGLEEEFKAAMQKKRAELENVRIKSDM